MIRPALLAASMLLANPTFASSDSEDDREIKRRGPPAVALEACANAVEHDPCSFEGRRGETVDGTCETRDDKPLACKPEGKSPKRELERTQ